MVVLWLLVVGSGLHFSGHLCTSDVGCKRVRNQQGGDSSVFPRIGVG